MIGVNPLAWKEVAMAKDHLNRPVSNLTIKMLGVSGNDQMSISQTRTYFSNKVSDHMQKIGYVVSNVIAKILLKC